MVIHFLAALIKFKNYAVKVLIQDCILPELNLQENDEPIAFIISIDNRNIRVGELNNLETYLKTEFCIYDDDFKITYYDSKTNYGIQLADLTVNTFYNSYKNIKIVYVHTDISLQRRGGYLWLRRKTM